MGAPGADSAGTTVAPGTGPPPARRPPPRRPRRRRALDVVLAVYLAGVAWATFGPAPYKEVDAAARRADAAGRAVLGGAAKGPGTGADDGAGGAASRREPSFGGLTGEEAANIVMFVPFGVLVPLRWRRWWWATVPAGAGLSCLIEGVQLVALDYRLPSWGDVRLNTLGAIVGLGLWLAGAAIRSAARRRGRSRSPADPRWRSV